MRYECQARQATPAKAAILQVSSSKHNAKKTTTRVRGPFHQPSLQKEKEKRSSLPVCVCVCHNEKKCQTNGKHVCVCVRERRKIELTV